MLELEINRRTTGINFKPTGEAEVCVWAPGYKAVDLVTGNRRRLPLSRRAFGYWYLETDQVKPGTSYRFLLDKKELCPDPASVSQPKGVHAPSQALALDSFTWTDEKWKNPLLESYILYELHTGTFTPEGTFEGVTAKLGYLKELGINAIELMPVAQFPGKRNWGYDGVFPFSVQHSYGGAEGLQKLVDACHRENIAVVLDVVYNHLGPEGNYLEKFGPYFTPKYKTPWGNAVNFDDAGSDEVRRFVIENVLMWFRDFHIDALRFDAIHAIRDFSPRHILADVRQYTDRLMKETGRVHHLIIETDLNDTRFINPQEKQGCGIDAQWLDEFHHALRVSAGEKPLGYYADYNRIRHLAKAYRDAYVYDGQYSLFRDKSFGVPVGELPGKQFVVFSQNHDQVGNRMLGERSSKLFSFEMQKLMAGAVMVSPYIPLLFMGEEWGETNPFLYFIDHSDPELTEAVRKGRREEFQAFHSQGEPPDPSGKDTFESSRLQWHLMFKEPHQSLFRYYKELINLRKKLPTLRALNRQQLRVSSSEQTGMLMLQRWNGEQHLVCLMNFSCSELEVVLPPDKKQYKNILDSAGTRWKGPADAPEMITAGQSIKLQPESLLLCSSCYV